MFASLLLAAHVSAAFIQTPGRPATAGKPLVSNDGGFTAVAPCDPVRQPPSAMSPSVLAMVFFVCNAGDFEVAVGMSEYVNLSPDSNLVFDGARAGMLKSIPQGKVASEENVTLAGVPGRAVHFVDTIGGVLRARFFFQKEHNRVFQIWARARRDTSPQRMTAFSSTTGS